MHTLCGRVAGVLVGLLLGGAAPASAASEWEITGPAAPPGSELSAVVSLDDGGRPALGVRRAGSDVLRSSPIGIQTADADLTTGLQVVGGPQTRVVAEDYRMTVGKRLTRHALMREARFELAGAGGARVDLVVRVAADGVAYRYELPAGPGGITVLREASSYQLPADAPAWLLPYRPEYESFHVTTTAGAASTSATGFGYPSLFQVGDSYVLISESDISGRYSGTRLQHAGSGRYLVALDGGNPVHHDADLATPWRVAIVGDLSTVFESTLVEDLAPPSRVADTSWIEPGVSAWSWLVEHQSPRDLERQKDFVDYAGEHGWPYVLVDEGWNADWVPELVDYAADRGVKLLLWFRWTDLETAEERDFWLPRVKDWGVAGVKIDFMNSDSQARYQWYDAVLADTAAQHLIVNFHGAQAPRGQQRTWPHIMSFEAVRGAEYYTFNIAGRPTAEHNTRLAFTRNVVGSMDYTPATFSPPFRQGVTSDAHEVALPVVFESGLTHLADKPETYVQLPEAEWLFDQLPTTWDETRLLGGFPGRDAVVARRSGQRWFVGAIAAGEPRTLSAPLGFLDGGLWLVEVVRDGAGGLVREAKVMSPSDTLTVPAAANGGFAAIACRWRAGRTTCGP
jgi:alpha-glucosidase